MGGSPSHGCDLHHTKAFKSKNAVEKPGMVKQKSSINILQVFFGYQTFFILQFVIANVCFAFFNPSFLNKIVDEAGDQNECCKYPATHFYPQAVRDLHQVVDAEAGNRKIKGGADEGQQSSVVGHHGALNGQLFPEDKVFVERRFVVGWLHALKVQTRNSLNSLNSVSIGHVFIHHNNEIRFAMIVFFQSRQVFL